MWLELIGCAGEDGVRQTVFVAVITTTIVMMMMMMMMMIQGRYVNADC
jgi:hypothetical protein